MVIAVRGLRSKLLHLGPVSRLRAEGTIFLKFKDFFSFSTQNLQRVEGIFAHPASHLQVDGSCSYPFLPLLLRVCDLYDVLLVFSTVLDRRGSGNLPLATAI